MRVVSRIVIPAVVLILRVFVQQAVLLLASRLTLASIIGIELNVRVIVLLKTWLLFAHLITIPLIMRAPSILLLLLRVFISFTRSLSLHVWVPLARCVRLVLDAHLIAFLHLSLLFNLSVLVNIGMGFINTLVVFLCLLYSIVL